MNYKKTFFSFVLILVSVGDSMGQVGAIVQNDFTKMIGSWHGSLTYLDYSTGKPFSMPANLTIRPIENSNNFTFDNSYPKEPSANSIDTFIISNDGKMIDKATLQSREKLSNGDLKIITEVAGKDGNDNKDALMRHTYILGTNILVITKEVQFSGQKEWIKRHEFSYAK